MRFVPHTYQQRAIDFILDHPKCALFLDMGLGKTVITLTAVQQLMIVCVFRLRRKHHKIVGRIVGLVPVNVVNNLTGKQRPSQDLLGHDTMCVASEGLHV